MAADETSRADSNSRAARHTWRGGFWRKADWTDRRFIGDLPCRKARTLWPRRFRTSRNGRLRFRGVSLHGLNDANALCQKPAGICSYMQRLFLDSCNRKLLLASNRDSDPASNPGNVAVITRGSVTLLTICSFEPPHSSSFPFVVSQQTFNRRARVRSKS